MLIEENFESFFLVFTTFLHGRFTVLLVSKTLRNIRTFPISKKQKGTPQNIARSTDGQVDDQKSS